MPEKETKSSDVPEKDTKNSSESEEDTKSSSESEKDGTPFADCTEWEIGTAKVVDYRGSTTPA
ncbi:hypothetical protein E4U55_006580 [Claviceps digitariae]|nr:hypothetical protein E4U55_006580 [Claviceps digitariae]